MKNLIEEKKSERGKALFEIILMIASIVAVAYFLGDEFKIVSAAGNTPALPCTEDWACGDWSTCSGGTQTRMCSDLNSCGKAPATESQACVDLGSAVSTAGSVLGAVQTGSALLKPTVAPTAASVPAAAVTAPAETLVHTGPEGAATPGATFGETVYTGTPTPLSAWWTKFSGAVVQEAGMMLINAGIAVGFYFATYYAAMAICPTCNPASMEQAALWVAGGYAVASIGTDLIVMAFGGAALGPWSMLIGLAGAAIGLAIWWLFFGNYYVEIVSFTCQPWQPQTGGSSCEACNNRDLPCTEYKCRSLGVNCQLLNPGTNKELCTAINTNDFTPPTITAWESALQDNFAYAPLPEDVNFPADKGVYVNYAGSSDNCAPPFTKITFGVHLNEPGQCRVSKNRTNTYNEMNIKLSSNQYRYDHGILVVNPSKESLEAADLTQPNGGQYQLYVRCQDGHDPANQNIATYVFKYCIQQQEDTSAPSIQMTSPVNGWPIQNHRTSQDVQLFVDKPSTCKWDHNDVDYSKMSGGICQTGDIKEVKANMLYECDTTLIGLKDGAENKVYIRCNSYNDHANQNSYVYRLIGTQPLVLDSVTVNGQSTGATIKDASQSVKVTFAAHTSAGYDNGAATCELKPKSETKWTTFLNTHTYESSQDLWFGKGSYTYNVKCCDIGGNCQTNDVSFTVDTDFQSPIVVRAYNEANSLKIETNEKAECVYDTASCSYNFDDGLKFTTSDNINHFVDWDPSTNFYIKCKDNFGNQPLPNQCSITVRPFNSA